jgi:hypothetical protein
MENSFLRQLIILSVLAGGMIYAVEAEEDFLVIDGRTNETLRQIGSRIDERVPPVQPLRLL